MNVLERMKLIDDIGRELQSRMKFAEIDTYFKAYGIPTDHQPSYNSKYVYVKEILPDVDDEIIGRIAAELNISGNFESKLPSFKDSTVTFWKAGHFKLFISHLSSFKVTIGHLKSALAKYGISCFVAHEDIEPTKEWLEEIEKGLFSMDALCAVLMPGFKESNWTDQEVGVAIGRGVLVVPIRRNLDPYGLIGKFQGYQALSKNVDQVAEGVFEILSKNFKTKDKITACLVDLLLLSNSKTEALERLSVLSKIDLSQDRILQLKDRFTENENLNDRAIIAAFNVLTKKYSVGQISHSDFQKGTKVEDDDLPF